MADEAMRRTWASILESLAADPGVTPPLYGFASLIEPKGIMAGLFILKFPMTSPAAWWNSVFEAPCWLPLATWAR